VEREWKETVLPKAVKFYLNNMLHRIEASVLDINQLAAVRGEQSVSRPVLLPPGLKSIIQVMPNL
jgi:hypothetical protein